MLKAPGNQCQWRFKNRRARNATLEVNRSKRHFHRMWVWVRTEIGLARVDDRSAYGAHFRRIELPRRLPANATSGREALLTARYRSLDFFERTHLANSSKSIYAFKRTL